MKILVRRTGAWGDVLETTPVLRRLRQENPDAEIDFETSAYYQGVYFNSPHRIGAKRTEVQYDRFIDLDGAFEKRLRKVNAVESYMEEAFGDRNGSTQLELTYDPQPIFDTDWSKVITMHAYCALPQWKQRTLPDHFWINLADILVDRGWNICCIGTPQDWSMAGRQNVFDTTRLLLKNSSSDQLRSITMQEQAAIIGASRAFVCCGSGPLMLAQVTDVPIVAMEAMSLPYMFEHHRHGVMGWRMYSMMPMKNGRMLECAGCSARMDEPTTYFQCPRTDKPNECMELFDPIVIADEVEAAAHLGWNSK